MPKKPDLAFALGLPPQKAVAYFRSKGYAITWNWYDTWQEAHAKAFTVAKVMRADILMDIRSMVDKALKDGLTFEQFRKELEPRLREKGWWGKKEVRGPGGRQVVQLGSPYRLRTIYETNMQTAYMAGRYQGMKENAEKRPYWMYIQVQRATKRAEHAVLHGKVFRHDDPIWKTHYPPNGWRCKCRVRALSKRRLEAEGLNIESSQGRLDTFEKQIATNKLETAKVTRYTTPGGRSVTPEPGWNYNVGEAAFAPNLGKYPDELAKLYKVAVGLAPRKTSAPVADALKSSLRGRLQQAFERVMKRIAAVHDDGEIDPIPVLPTDLGGNTNGAFFLPMRTGGAPLAIHINPNAPRPELTIAHEIAHLIDRQGIGIKNILATHSTNVDSRMRAFLDTAYKTESVRKIKEIIKTGRFTLFEQEYIVTESLRGHLYYLLAKHEIFARAYAQWVATKTGDEVMLQQIKAIREAPLDKLSQWHDKEFEPLAKELDNLFQSLGWLKR